MILMTRRLDNPKTLIDMVVLSSGSLIFNKAFSPLAKVPSNVFLLIYNSNVGTVLFVFCDVLSTTAVAPDVVPVIFLFCRRLKSKAEYKTSISAPFAGAVLKINFLDSRRTLYPVVWTTPLI